MLVKHFRRHVGPHRHAQDEERRHAPIADRLPNARHRRHSLHAGDKSRGGLKKRERADVVLDVDLETDL